MLLLLKIVIIISFEQNNFNNHSQAATILRNKKVEIANSFIFSERDIH